VNGKYEIETKLEVKDRIGHSPDLADWAAGIVEMARRKGFMIQKLANEAQDRKSLSWFHALADKQRALAKERELVSA
jgi:hypothetical protein